jgi:TonB-linked SusC/RagA family outer membrane protein
MIKFNLCKKESKWKNIAYVCIFLLSFCSTVAFAQGNTVSGTVTDASGEPLIGVSVFVRGTSIGTVTNIDGNYTLSQVQPQSVIVLSYLGYVTQEITAGNQRTINVQLLEDTQLLDEVVVIGYGIQRRSVVTAAISSVRSTDIEKITPTRIDHVLRGQVSGVSITQNSGAPNSNVQIRIRGVGTTGDNNPLYIIDGMAISGRDGTTTSGSIANINPADIASIEILKDAASAAVYGTRGGNGVVLITTKRGAEGRPRITYEMTLGWQNPARRLSVLNSEQYMALQNERRINNNELPEFTHQDLADARAGRIPNTDWQDVAFNKNAPIASHQVSIQGGNAKGSYFLSLGNLSQDGILGGNFGVSNYDRWTVRINNDYEVFNVEPYRNFLNKVRAGANVTYSRTNSIGISNNTVFGTVLQSALSLPPTMAPYLDEEAGKALLDTYPYALVHDGRVLTPSPADFLESRNPLAIYLRPDRTYNNEDKFVGTFWGDVNVLPGMVFRSSYGFDLAFWGENGYRFPFFQSYNTQGLQDMNTANTQAWAEMNRQYTWQIENTLSYDFRINNHSFTLLAGQSARKSHRQMLSGRGYDLSAYDPWLAIINMARMGANEGGRRSNGDMWDTALTSYFGRISWNYDERYMLQATVRRDGSYKFGDRNKWGNFPSFSAGWNAWNEPYLEDVRPEWWSSAKLRGSWGINGSDRISDWSYMALMETGLNYYFGSDTDRAMHYGISAGRLPNPYIHWEESRQTNLGADFTFLRNALSFNFDWFKKRTVDMLRDAATVPSYVGQSPPRVNAGIIDNTGVEFDLGYRFAVTRDLNVGIRANASYIKNTVVNYGNASGEYSTGGIGAAGIENMVFQRNGFPNPFFYGFVTDGIIQTQEEADEYNKQYNQRAVPGDVKFKDLSGPDGVPDDQITSDDRQVIGKPNPDWVFGLTLTADYKGFDFYAFLQGVYGCEIFDVIRRADMPKGNMPSWMLDRWTGPGTSDRIPRLSSGEPNNNWRASDLYIQDGSYTRLKNIQIGYTLPGNITRQASIERLRLWIGAENLLTFTKYDGYDPEIGSESGVSRMGNYPQARTLNIGVGITF